MKSDHILAAVLLGIIAAALGFWVYRRFYSPDARWERRRRRSNAPLMSTSKRPTVKFSVRTKKKRRK